MSHHLLELSDIIYGPATSLSSSLQLLWPKSMKCYEAREADFFLEASDRGSHEQSRQIMDVTWEHSPPLLQVNQALLAHSSRCAPSSLLMWGWLLLTLAGINAGINQVT